MRGTALRKVMSRLPSSVVVVTAHTPQTKRGITCTSFTSVSLSPPIVSFALRTPSRFGELLTSSTNPYCIHFLSDSQAHYANHFATAPLDNSVSQFTSVPHRVDQSGALVIPDTPAILTCTYFDSHHVGDHDVVYGKVVSGEISDSTVTPVLFYDGSYRTVGDSALMKAFEDTTLAFEDWTHEAHVRMAWNYLKATGREEAEIKIKTGIKRYNLKNQSQVQVGYHETITSFFIDAIAAALQVAGAEELTFEEFSSRNPQLFRRDYLMDFYTKDVLFGSQAKREYVRPDKRGI